MEMCVPVLDFTVMGVGWAGRQATNSYTIRDFPAPTVNGVPIQAFLPPVLIVNRPGPEKGMLVRSSKTLGMRIWVCH